MVKLLHRTPIVPPMRYDPMMTQPAGDWSVVKPIFTDHWDAFPHAHPHDQTPY